MMTSIKYTGEILIMKCPFTETSNQSFIFKKDAYNIHDDKHKIYLRNFKIMKCILYPFTKIAYKNCNLL